MALEYETLGLHRLNDINLVVDFSEIGQELYEKLLNECIAKWHAILDRENNNKLRTLSVIQKRIFVWTIPRDANY